MFAGDQSRKQTLIDFGFRLPSAKDNRPLNFKEFNSKINQVIYVSATPSDYELNKSIHDYGNEPEENNLYIPNDESLKTIIGIPYELAENSLKLVKSDIDDIYLEYKKNKVEDFVLSKKVVSPFKILGGGIKGKKKKGLNLFIEKAPQHTMNFIEMRNYINDRFIKYKWDKIKFENGKRP